MRIGAMLACLALTGATVLVGAPAQAATSSTTGTLALSCPSSGALCLYRDNGFLNITDVLNGSANLTGTSANNNASSVRNRSSCAYRLYDAGSPSGSYITIPAHTEYSQIGTTFGSFWNDRVSYAQVYC
ncbi:peptidase inhibitor family I36 protein [Micromonospora sp. NPDC050980]|uniref:peptidase inhibitor family I36 protein n=1 Tax=Micromonospora sp. NPDC050980 TaxID=3155161 RepID=UPI0033D14589